MNKKEQAKFVKELCTSIQGGILRDIQQGKIPENWDGLELRALIAERADRANYINMPRARKRAFNNTVIVNNL